MRWSTKPSIATNSLVGFFDVPHLMKTTRNCLSHSYPNNRRRSMMVRNGVIFQYYIGVCQINEKFVTWKHIRELYDKCRLTTDRSLAILPRLKLEHIELTSYSRMRVDLASAGRTFKRACVVARVIYSELAFSVGSLTN